MKSLAVLRQIKEKIKPTNQGVTIYPNSARRTGCLIIGQPGAGKTRHLEGWIMNDILAGRGVGVFDLHGDLHRNLLYRLAALVPRYPRLAGRLVVIDPTSPTDGVVSFNPLAAIEGMPLERVAAFMSDVIIKIWNINPAESPRMAYLMTQSFLALADLELTLLDLPRFLHDRAWRNSLLPQLTQAGVRTYFTHEFPTSPGEIQTWVAPLLNKVSPLLFDRQNRLLLAGNAKVNFRQILDEQKILLVHLPKGIIGEEAASLLGALLVALIQKAALSRADRPDRPQFYLYLDEFQNVATTHISDVLSESRKFGLTLILAHQFLAQVTNEELRSAVINTTGALICFRIGYKDARSLVADIFPCPTFLADQGVASWEGLALELANLPNRVYWLRRRGPFAPVRKATREMPDPAVTPQIEANLARLLEISGRRYGRGKRELQQELAEMGASQPPSLTASQRRRYRKKQKPAGVNLAAESAMLGEHEQPSDGQADHLLAPTGGNGRGNLDELWN
ncbi:MAG: type IV secretory system conjugative DNA transfer family protein [Chloroflexota bacterium]